MTDTEKYQQLVDALSNIVGEGAQHEITCDLSEHDNETECIWCLARTALKDALT